MSIMAKVGAVTCRAIQTLWIGIQHMRDYALAWETFGPACCPTKKCVER